MKTAIALCAALLLASSAASAQGYRQTYQPYQPPVYQPYQAPQQSWTGIQSGNQQFWQGSRGGNVTCNRVGNMTFCN